MEILEGKTNILPSIEVLSYEFKENTKLGKGEEPLGKVIGHDNQKKELLSIIDWFKHSKELKAKGITIPKGIILFGDPGNGKSLLIKEIIRCCEAPVLIFAGEENNIAEGIINTFKKAREYSKEHDDENVIIVLDELDLLINKERRVVRALQENLDGVNSDDNILVLAATNELEEIPAALTRHGRLEKLILIPYPNADEIIKLLKKNFDDFNIKLPDDFDEEEIALALNGVSCAGIKAFVNDLILRNGFDNITSDAIDNSLLNITEIIKNAEEEANYDIAIHEASHASLAYAYPQYFKVNRLIASSSAGKFHVKDIVKGFWPYDKIIAHIKISMAGVIGEKIICGTGSRGCESDLQNARSYAYNMINMCGYSSCWETLPDLTSRGVRTDTPYKRRKNERKIEKLLRRCEKETTKYIKSHKHQIIALGSLLYEKKHLKANEVISCLSRN